MNSVTFLAGLLAIVAMFAKADRLGHTVKNVPSYVRRGDRITFMVCDSLASSNSFGSAMQVQLFKLRDGMFQGNRPIAFLYGEQLEFRPAAASCQYVSLDTKMIDDEDFDAKEGQVDFEVQIVVQFFQRQKSIGRDQRVKVSAEHKSATFTILNVRNDEIKAFHQGADYPELKAALFDTQYSPTNILYKSTQQYVIDSRNKRSDKHDKKAQKKGNKSRGRNDDASTDSSTGSANTSPDRQNAQREASQSNSRSQTPGNQQFGQQQQGSRSQHARSRSNSNSAERFI